jgi:hypothetical protein
LAKRNFEKPTRLNLVARSIDEPIGTVHCVAIAWVFDMIVQAYSIASSKQPLAATQITFFHSSSSTSTGGVGKFGGHPPPGWVIRPSRSSFLARHLLLAIFLI